MEDHHEDVQVHRLECERVLLRALDDFLQVLQGAPEEGRRGDASAGHHAIQRCDGVQQGRIGLMRFANQLVGHLKPTIGRTEADGRVGREHDVVDDVELLAGQHELVPVPAYEVGHLDGDHPVLEAEQPVDQDRNPVEEEDGGCDHPRDQVGVREVIARLLEKLAEREIESGDVLQAAHDKHPLDPEEVRAPEHDAG